MPSAYLHPDALEAKLNLIKNNAERLLLVKVYVIGDAYATVIAGTNVVGAVAVAPADLIVSVSGNDRVLTIADKADNNALIATTGAEDTYLVLVDDTNSRVLYVTDETNQQVITAGNPLNWPAGLTLTDRQPTLV